MAAEGGFRPKSRSQLERQLRVAQEQVGEEAEFRLIPPSVEKDEILAMPFEELRKKYARRFEMYKRLNWSSFNDRGEVGDEEVEHMRRWLKALNSLDTYIQDHQEGNVETTLREKQITVFEDLRSFVEAGGTEGYVKLPTGVGKTVLFSEFVEALDLKTMIVVPTKLLVIQTEKKLNQFAPGLEIGKVMGGKKEFGRNVTVITYASLMKQIRSGKIDPKEYDCLILDEAHTSLSEERSKLPGLFTQAIKIGFTATPNYSEKKQLVNLLGTEIHNMSVREAVEDSLLSSFSSIVAETTIDISQVPTTESGEWDPEELAKAINTESRNIAAVQLYQEAFAGETAVVYCVGVAHATEVSKKFNTAGVSAAVVSGMTSIRELDSIFAKYKAGEIKVICNADLLIAGFDEPRASVCLNLRPTKSYVISEQRGGRVLRLDEDNQNKFACIVDFLDQGIDPENPPVLFADVAGGVTFQNKKGEKGKGRGGNGGQGAGGGVGPGGQDAGWKYPIKIDGLKVIVDPREIMKIVQKFKEGKEEENPDSIRRALAEQGVSAKDWVGLSTRDRSKVQVNKLKLKAISRLFNLFGSPVDNDEDFMELCRKVFGTVEVNKILESFTTTPEDIRKEILARGQTAKDWIGKTVPERAKIKVLGLKITAIARVFGITGQPVKHTRAYLNLCLKIFGEVEEVKEAISLIEVTPEDIRKEILARGQTAKDWIFKSYNERSMIIVKGLKLKAIARVFGLKGNPVDINKDFFQLCGSIFGREEVDSILRNLGRN